MSTNAERQARYRQAQTARRAQLEGALRTAHAMLDKIEQGGSYRVADWDKLMGRIERALGKATARAQAGEQ